MHETSLITLHFISAIHAVSLRLYKMDAVQLTILGDGFSRAHAGVLRGRLRNLLSKLVIRERERERERETDGFKSQPRKKKKKTAVSKQCS